MNANETILTQYRDANDDERLSLFVFHRDLHAAFSQIDLESDATWSTEALIELELPKISDLLITLKNAVRQIFDKQNAPVRH